MNSINYKDEGNKFHLKVANILKNSGFQIIKSDFNAKGPDIEAEFRGIKIIIQCRHSPERNFYRHLREDVDSYSTKAKKFNARKSVLALSKYKLPNIDEITLEKWLIDDNVAIWTDNIIENYKALSESIGNFAGVQIISDLGIKEDFLSDPPEVQATKVEQNGKKFYLMKLAPAYLLKAAKVVRRTRDSKKLYQRYITKKRVKQEIPDYIVGSAGIFPNSIILASEEKLVFRQDKLVLPKSYGSFVIIDGQHRLYSFCNIKDNKLSNEFELPITIFDGTELNSFEQANIFAKINNSAKRVPSSLILEINRTVPLGSRLPRPLFLLDKFKKTKYFESKIREYSKRGGSIDGVTFCTAKAFQDLTKDDGIILKGKGNLSQEKKDLLCYSYLNSFFKIVYNTFRIEWQRPKIYILSTNKGYRALLRLFSKILIYTNGKNDEKEYRRILLAMKKSVSYIKKAEVGSGGGEGAANDLASKWSRIINDSIPDFDESVTTEKVLKESYFKRGETDKVKTFLSKNGNNFTGILRGKLAFIDISTISLLIDNFSNIEEFRIIAGNVKNEDSIKLKINKLEKKIEILKYKKIHERWLADDQYLLELNTDLKDDAIANNDSTKKLLKFTDRSEKISKFDQDWYSLTDAAVREVSIITKDKTDSRQIATLPNSA